jgi:hypothetical protein
VLAQLGTGTGTATGGPAVLVDRVGVHRAERGGGGGGEHLGVLGDPSGDALVVAGGPGVDEVPGVAGVGERAGRTHRGAAVAAADQQLPVRLAGRAVPNDLPERGLLDDAALEPDGPGAPAGAFDLLGPTFVVGAAGAGDDLVPRPLGRRLGRRPRPGTRSGSRDEGVRRGGHAAPAGSARPWPGRPPWRRMTRSRRSLVGRRGSRGSLVTGIGLTTSWSP